LAPKEPEELVYPPNPENEDGSHKSVEKEDDRGT
jgi:hypothetical protein